MKKIITIITILVLLLNIQLYSNKFYIWLDYKDEKLFCFDRETETLNEKLFSNVKKNVRDRAIMFSRVTYVSNFIVADYSYHPYKKKHVRDYRNRGGLAIWDIRDGSYREIEAKDLVDGYFSSLSTRTDSSRTKLIFSLVKVEDWGQETDEHELDNFKWDINNEDSPVQISLEEYRNLVRLGIRSISQKQLKAISTKNPIPYTYADRDYAFVYGDKMLVWAHEESRYYVLREMPNYEYRNISFISIDGLRSVNMAR